MSVTSIHLIYKKEFEPIVRPNENIAVAESTDSDSWKFYRVKYIEPFFINYTTGTITNGSSIDIDLSDLELGKNEIAQIRVLIQTNGFELEAKLPEAVSKYTTKNTVTRIDYWVSTNYPHLTEMFYQGRYYPKFKIYNNSGADGTCNIRIIGFRYVLEPLSTIPREYTVIYTSTVPSKPQ